MNILRRLEQLEEELLPPAMMQMICTINIVEGRRGDGFDPEKGDANWVYREPIVIEGEPFAVQNQARGRRYGRRRGSR